MRTVVGSGRNAIGRALVAVAAAAVSAACGSSGGGEPEASCAFRVEYDERVYADVAGAEFEIGEELGPAVLPPCDDSPGDGDGRTSPEPVVAHAVEGVDPGVAIALDDAPDGVLFVAVGSGGALPPEIEKLIKGS
ncbi:DUF6281 family protein [Streptomyces sp. enrichment culture]|uniref:DUF6281 family protein n=1 Tax=Streptomyces sp. enrichment culture TaxID=1795815 RepID=UPI003F5525B4